MSMERGRFGNVVSFAGHRVGEARGSNAEAARIAAAGVSTAALRLCALRDLGGLDLRLSAALALCSPLGESASVTRGAAESLSNVVRTGGGGWLVVMAAARAVSAGCWAEPGRSAIVIMHFALWLGMKCVLCGLVKWICGARTRTLSV